MRKWGRRLLLFLGQCLVIAAVVVAVSIGTQGMYLLGVPAVDEVESVTVTYEGRTEEVEDAEGIELAVKLTGFLRYSLFDKADGLGEPLAVITYHLRDGREVSVDANRETVWWHSEAHALREKEIFMNLLEGIFFS